jgi:hypothetical protein
MSSPNVIFYAKCQIGFYLTFHPKTMYVKHSNFTRGILIMELPAYFFTQIGNINLNVSNFLEVFKVS